MNREQTARFLAVVAETWRGFEVSQGKIAIWHEMLSDVPLEQAFHALQYLIATGSPFPPAISEIRKALVEISAPPEYRIDALQAWLEASIIVEGYCEEEGMALLSPLTREVVRAIGWNTMREGDPEVVRAHFLKFFEMAKERWLRWHMLPEGLRPQSFELPAPPPPARHNELPDIPEEVREERKERFLQAVGELLRRREKEARAV